MEDIENKVNQEDCEIPISKVYVIDNVQVTVRRKFEKGGTSILEQILALLLDLMEKAPTK